MSEGRLVVTRYRGSRTARHLARARVRAGQGGPAALASPRPAPGRTPGRPPGVAGTSGSARELGEQKGAVVTSARFYHLSEMVLEAADYLADHDHLATERLNGAGALLAAIGGREAARERGGREQPALPGMDMG